MLGFEHVGLCARSCLRHRVELERGRGAHVEVPAVAQRVVRAHDDRLARSWELDSRELLLVVLLERGAEGLDDVGIVGDDVLDIWRAGLDAARSRTVGVHLPVVTLLSWRCLLVVRDRPVHGMREHTSPGGADSMKAARAAVSVGMVSFVGDRRWRNGNRRSETQSIRGIGSSSRTKECFWATPPVDLERARAGTLGLLICRGCFSWTVAWLLTCRRCGVARSSRPAHGRQGSHQVPRRCTELHTGDSIS